MNAYLEAVENEINRLEDSQRKFREEVDSKIDEGNNQENEDTGIIYDLYSSRLKLMKRNKRFFLYRKRLLEVKRDGEYSNTLRTNFQKRFQLDKNVRDLDKLSWFDHGSFI